MFDNSQLLRQAQLSGSLGAPDPLKARRDMTTLYWRAYAVGQWRRLWRNLSGQSSRLRSLTSVTSGVAQRINLGLQTIPLAKIRGSEGRANDFDVDFLPSQTHSKDRWIDIAAARQLGKPLPPVVLIQVGDAYFVRDGHHRLSVARLMGQATIDAEVMLWR